MLKQIDEISQMMEKQNINTMTIHNAKDSDYGPETIELMQKAEFLYSVTFVYNSGKTKQNYYFKDGKQLDFRGFREKVYGKNGK